MTTKALQTAAALWKPSAEPRDGMTRAQLHVQRNALRTALRRLDDIQTSCNTCRHFDFVKTCSLHGEVPPEFISTPEQCDDWAFESIPF
jgi:hypothetical protein